MVFLSTCTPIKHHNKTPFMEKVNPKCDQKKIEKLPNSQTSKWKWD
jgi:hypothetical protein